MRGIIALFCLVLFAVPSFAVDISRDILRNQETVIGNYVYTGVKDDNGEIVVIDASVNEVAFKIDY